MFGCLEDAGRTAGPGGGWGVVASTGDPELEGVAWLWTGPAPELRRAWLCAARLEEHALPAGRPLAFWERPSGALAAFELPESAAPTGVGGGPEGHEGPEGREQLLAALRDRGLAPDPAARTELFRSARGAWGASSQPVSSQPASSQSGSGLWIGVCTGLAAAPDEGGAGTAPE